MPKKLPIGISNLREIIQEGYVYVDKSRYVYKLVSTGKYYFLKTIELVIAAGCLIMDLCDDSLYILKN